MRVPEENRSEQLIKQYIGQLAKLSEQESQLLALHKEADNNIGTMNVVINLLKQLQQSTIREVFEITYSTFLSPDIATSAPLSFLRVSINCKVPFFQSFYSKSNDAASKKGKWFLIVQYNSFNERTSIIDTIALGHNLPWVSLIEVPPDVSSSLPVHVSLQIAYHCDNSNISEEDNKDRGLALHLLDFTLGILDFATTIHAVTPVIFNEEDKIGCCTTENNIHQVVHHLSAYNKMSGPDSIAESTVLPTSCTLNFVKESNTSECNQYDIEKLAFILVKLPYCTSYDYLLIFHMYIVLCVNLYTMT